MDPQKPYTLGYFKISDGHKLYYELWGNPQGKPAVFLHGGPGAGFDDHDKAYFDPTVWNVLFFDQRGAGKSKPFASLEHNTTQDLVVDIKTLMEHVGFKKTLLLGGSWGSTLALCFAIAYPEMVSEMIIRGIMTLTDEEFTYYLAGGTSLLFPYAWKRFLSHVPTPFEHDPISFYDKKILHGTSEEKNKYMYEFVRYELRLLLPKASEKELDEFLKKDTTWRSMGPLEIHYMANKCFVPSNYIYDNLKKVHDIPISIIQGKNDMIAPLFAAQNLHYALPKSRLFITNAGHFGSEKGNKQRTIAEIKKFGKIL